jgi:hypothetical protein
MRTLLIGRTARRSLRSRSPLLPGFITVIILTLAVAACGVKNDLAKPNGQATSKDESDPSKPPYPIGR